jgi:hypothetical protein
LKLVEGVTTHIEMSDKKPLMMTKSKEKQISKRRFQERQEKRKRAVEREKNEKQRKRVRKEVLEQRQERNEAEDRVERDHGKITAASLKHLFSLAKMHYTNPSLAQFYMYQFNKLARNNDFGKIQFLFLIFGRY